MPKEPRRAPNESRSGRKYTCACIKFCKGVEREIAKSTYLRHTKFMLQSELSPADTSVGSAVGENSSESHRIVNDLLRPDNNSFVNTGDLSHDPQTGVDLDRDHPTDNSDRGCLDDLTTENFGQQYPENVANDNVDSESTGNLNDLFENTKLEELCITNTFIRELQNASLDGRHSNLDQEALDQLRNPPTATYTLDEQPDLRLAFDIFLASLTASVNIYNTTRASILRCHPGDDLPSYDQMKKILAKITGVGSLVHPMCRNSCVAFTGPFTDLDLCPKCGESKCCPISGKYYQEFHTMPIGPILQALWRDPQSARRFDYRRRKTREIIQSLHDNAGILSAYEDFFHGSDYLEQVQNGNI